jgi:hypothetical protein
LQARHFDHWPNLDGADSRPGDAGGDTDGLVEILGIDKKIAAQLLARLREGTVGHMPFAVADPYAGGRGHRLQRVGGQIPAVRVQLVCELGGFFVTVLALCLIHGVLAHVDQQHIFHGNVSFQIGTS